MNERVWVEMPVVGTEEPDDRVRPKYPVHGQAFLIHQAGKVYVAFPDALAREEILKQDDCRILTATEARAFEESLPFPLPDPLFSNSSTHSRRRRVGLGDVIAWLTGKARISECDSCQQRKRWLNRIVVWGWWRA